VLLLGVGALSVTGVLAIGPTSVPPPSDEGVVWIYFASLCANPGDASDCKRIDAAFHPVFSSLEACDAYRDRALAEAGNPSCLRQRDA
jgi:hypothetical protein